MEFKKGDLVICIDAEHSDILRYGKVYEISRNRKAYVDIIIDGKVERGFFPKIFKYAIPNNKLSRVMYPKLVPTECKRYLCSSK